MNPQVTDHDYLSTACLHEIHDRCRLNCKFCQVPCICTCHSFCPACQRPMSAHDADPIGAGLTQYNCPEEST